MKVCLDLPLLLAPLLSSHPPVICVCVLICPNMPSLYVWDVAAGTTGRWTCCTCWCGSGVGLITKDDLAEALIKAAHQSPEEYQTKMKKLEETEKAEQGVMVVQGDGRMENMMGLMQWVMVGVSLWDLTGAVTHYEP